jgi:acetoin utilization protein AcuC
MGASRGLLVWDERFLDYDFGPDHPFTQQSRRDAVRLLETLIPREHDLEVAREVEGPDRTVLETFHEPDYVELVHRAGLRWGAPVPLDNGDTPSFSGCFEAAARIAAGTARAVDFALEHRASSFQPAGGLHHARPERASGFCIFNDVALGIARAVAAGHRVAYLDIDAHHGDGVMYGFYRTGKVLAIDFHQDGRTLFPGTGAAEETGQGDGKGLKVNVPLPPGAGDAILRPLFHRLVPPLIRSFRPGLIVLQHGADGHVGDPLTALEYTSRAYDDIDRTVLALAREVCDRRLVVTGGGGYRPEAVARVLARAGAATLHAPLPALDDALPRTWRSQFESEWSRPPPVQWGDALPAPHAAWSSDDSDDLVRTLERELGVTFPREAPP